MALADVPACFFCASGQDSVLHIYSSCPVVNEARSQFLSRHGLPSPSPFTLGHSFLFLPRGTPLPASYSAAPLSFSTLCLAPVRYAALERDPSWRIARVVELADTIFTRPHPSRQKAR